MKLQEIESKSRQNTWLDFTNKATNQKAGHFAFKTNQESIFKSPDTIMGKVGVVGSGKQMTTYDPMKLKASALLGTGHERDKSNFLGDNKVSKRPRYD